METTQTKAKLVKSIMIDASVDKVFAYLDEPQNLPEVWPSLQEVSNVQRLANGGTKYDWSYKMAGMNFYGTSEQTEHVLNKKIIDENKGGINCVITWTFEELGDSTRLTCETEYDIPIPLLGRLAERFIIRLNENESEMIMANIKARLEA